MIEIPGANGDRIILDYLALEKELLISIRDPDTLEGRTTGLQDIESLEILIDQLKEFHNKMMAR